VSRRKTDEPRTAKTETRVVHGSKPKTKECFVTDAKGKVDWERTARDFPITPKGGRG
jgi:hypothetical protein